MPVVYKALCMAFASFIRIQQLNLKDCTQNKQIQWLMKAMNYKKTQAVYLWERVLHDSAVNNSTGKINHVGERRVKWMTYHNLNLWFDAWEKVLIETGFF